MLNILKKILPVRFKQFLIDINRKINIIKLDNVHKKALEEIKTKTKIKIAFLLVDESIWKYDYVYKLFENNPRYELIIFSCPQISYGEKLMNERMDKAISNFKNNGFNIIDTRTDDGLYLDLKKYYKPDLVFFCTPWDHTLEKYQISNFLDTLTIYVPYGFKNSSLYSQHFSKDMMNYTWKFFLETEIHKKLAKKYSLNKGKNAVVTGFPGLDVFLDSNYVVNEDVWKKQNIQKKRIIWAPHHTIPGARNLLSYSTFLSYADFMLRIAKQYESEIQIVFKPHPILRKKLNEIWGEVKTDIYYDDWNKLSNGQVEEGSYIDLFATSDAMIHDSGSFVIEYLYTKKPVMFLISSEKVKEEFNEIGKEALRNIDLGYNENDIIRFINEVVIGGNDNMKEKRLSFFTNLVQPPNNVMASENIYNHINTELKK